MTSITRRTLVAAVLIFGFLAVAQAECTRPDSPLPLPKGASATKPEMVDAMHRVRAYNDSINEYLHCLQSETDQLKVGAATAEQQQALERQEELHNAAVEHLVGVSNCFNEELRAFNAGGDGAGGVETDCAAQLAAAEAGADPNSPVATVDLVESEPVVSSVATGEWSYFLRRGGDRVPCEGHATATCELSRLVIRNDSEESLRCDVGITYPRSLEISGKGVVRPHSERVVLRQARPPDEVPKAFRAECEGFAPVPASTRADECNFKITKPVILSDYYPERARVRSREGEVMIEFTLAEGEGKAGEIQVAESSLYNDLDAAAVEAISDMAFDADCSGQRHRLVIDFELVNE